jgi:hypothetical protein
MSKTKTKTKGKAARSTTKTKASRRITKASTSKTSAIKTSSPTADDDVGLLVLGFDEQQKPCGARFVDAKPDLVAKAAQLMGLKVYKPTFPEVAEVAKKLPVGQLYATGRAFVPHVRQSLYSDVIVALATEPHGRPGCWACRRLGRPRPLPRRKLLRATARRRTDQRILPSTLPCGIWKPGWMRLRTVVGGDGHQ